MNNKILFLSGLLFLCLGFLISPFSASADVVASEQDCIDNCGIYACEDICPSGNHLALWGHCKENCIYTFCYNETFPQDIPSSQVVNFQNNFLQNYPSCQWTTEVECSNHCVSLCGGGQFTEELELQCREECDDDNCDGGAWNNIQPGQLQDWLNNFKALYAPETIETNANTTTEPSFEIDRGDPVTTEINVENPLGDTTDPRDVVATIVRTALIFLGALTLVIFIISGIMMMTSGGNEERFKKARMAMVWAIIGLVIVLASYSILNFIFERLLTATGA